MTQATTQKLLTNLATAGLTLTVIQGGKLSVSPKSLLTDQIRSDIKAAMPDLIECLTPQTGEQTSPQRATVRPAGLSEKMLAASMALDAQQAGLPDDLPVTDGTWPSGPAWTPTELSTYQARYEAFMAAGMPESEAERVADASIFDDRRHGLPVATYTPTTAKQNPFSVTAPWRAFDREYLTHNAICTPCKRGNRCDVGAGLWRAYLVAFNDWSAP